jgi:hypothetical protein
MKSKLIKFLIATAVMASLSMTAQAQPVNGSISFSDQFTANGPLSSATALTSIFGVKVSNISGDYTLGAIVPGNPGPGTPVNFAGVTPGTPFTFSPIPGAAFANFWSINIGGTTYSFDVTATTYCQQTSQTITLEGTGTAYITGVINRTPTAGTWNLTLNQNGGLLNFSGGVSTPGVPDGGTTVLLLGAALSTLGLIKRRLS